MSPAVQRKLIDPRRKVVNQQDSKPSLQSGNISNARSMANLTVHDPTVEIVHRLNPSTSVNELVRSEDPETKIDEKENFSRKDPMHSSRRELPALGVSAAVTKGKPSFFEFWENLGQNQQELLVDTKNNNEYSRSSMRRVLPPLPISNGPSSLNVYTGNHCSASPNSGNSSEGLGSRGEVEGSSNQPSPTLVTRETAHHYWANVSNQESSQQAPHWKNGDNITNELTLSDMQLAQLHQMVRPPQPT